MAYLDAQNLFSDAQALTVTAVSTNYINLGAVTTQIGTGEPLAVVVTVDVAAAGGGTLTIVLQSDDNTSFSSAVTVATTAAIAAAALTASVQVVLTVPAGIATEQYIRLNYVLATMTGITLTSTIKPLSMVGVQFSYANATTV